METLECIRKRKSSRRYIDYKMSEKDIHDILEAGFNAPSAMNRRPYELIVNTDNAFWEDYKKEKPTMEIAKNASLTIIVVGDSNKNPTMEFLIEDASAVAENMLLAATSLGYASLWAGVKMDSDFAKRLGKDFNLPDGYLPIAVLIIGKSDDKKVQLDRYDPKKIHKGKKF